MKKLMGLFLPLISSMAFAQTSADLVKFGGNITQQGLKDKLTILASADMEGRETASPGQKKAAAYIESQFKKMGLKPGNGESYQQLYPVYQDELATKKIVVDGRSFEWDKDFSFSLQTIVSGEWTYQKSVFAGYGIVDSAKQINDYAHLDVKGKLVFVLEGNEAGAVSMQGGMRAMNANPASNYAKMKTAIAKGAAGLFIISSNFPRTQATATKGGMYIKRNDSNAGFLVATISLDVATALTGRSVKLSVADVKLLKKAEYFSEIKVAANKIVNTLESSNVIAVLPGSEKKDEYLMITGHYDHLGKRENVIWYGADDDGSGTVSVMQMAEAFAAAAKKGAGPKRNIVFMTVSGEEKGLLGSDYYSEHPIYPMDKTTADLNIDMVGRVDTERKTGDSLNYVYVIGHDKLSTDLPIINEAANKISSNITLDYKYDDPNDKNFIYYRSDHYNFAKKGVPILFFYDGMLLADYHKPTDTIEKINFELMQKRDLMIFYTAWDIANRPEMLKRDLKLNMPGR
ncbi:MAG: M28 family peptidase [Chitinophagaceae bacterium]|nr:M28 family peptidase [Chitinophagaceae bacterium]